MVKPSGEWAGDKAGLSEDKAENYDARWVCCWVRKLGTNKKELDAHPTPLFSVVGDAGVEPATFGFGGHFSPV